MRHVTLDGLRIPAGWLIRAAAALQRVRDAAPADRRDVISQNSGIWAEMNAALSELTDGKCWYCESRQIRSDQPVDHFRPKGAVYEDPTHPGYWWLAFDYNNYRFSCTFCNSRRRDVDNGVGGKGDRFPIRDEHHRARTEADPIAAEEPDLLDPLDPNDPSLLFFENDGRVVPFIANIDDSRRFHRAEVSIQIYHLNHSKTKRARKWIFNEIQLLIRDGDIYFSPGPEDARIQHARERVVDRVLQHRNEQRDYSAAVERYLRGFVNPDARAWLSEILNY